MKLWMVGVVLVAGLSGCAKAGTMPNPLVSGQVPKVRLVEDRAGEERRRNLPPGTLADEVVLTRLDQQWACFDVVLRRVQGEEEYLTDLQYWQPLLMTSGRDFVGQPQVQAYGATSTPFHGKVPHVERDGANLSCSRYNVYGECIEWSVRENERDVYTPGAMNVIAGGGHVCFAHQGLINPKTHRMTLRLDSDRGRQSFKWRFANKQGRPPRNPPPGPMPDRTGGQTAAPVQTAVEPQPYEPQPYQPGRAAPRRAQPEAEPEPNEDGVVVVPQPSSI